MSKKTNEDRFLPVLWVVVLTIIIGWTVFCYNLAIREYEYAEAKRTMIFDINQQDN